MLTGIFLVSLIQDTERGGRHRVIRDRVTMQSVIKTTFALLFCVALVTPLPKPDQMEAMEIYKYASLFVLRDFQINFAENVETISEPSPEYPAGIEQSVV